MRRSLAIFATVALFVLSISATSAFAKSIRLEVGLGGQGGDPDVEFAGVSDELDTDTGLAITAGLWSDGMVSAADWLSFGIQYLRLQDFDFSETASGTVLGVAVTGTLDLEPDIDAFMFNAAARQQSGKIHPFIGGGIGVAKSSVDASVTATFTVNNSTLLLAGTADDDDTNFAWQFFGGVDYDFTDNIYAGVNLRYFGTDATLFGADVEFRNLAAMGVIGYKF